MVQNIDGIAGSERYLLSIIPELKKHGFKVEMLVLYSKKTKYGHQNFLNKLEDLNIQSYQIERSIFSLNNLRRIIIEGSFEIVHSHLIHADFYCALSKWIFGFKGILVSTKHGYDEYYMNQNGLEIDKSFSIYKTIAWFSEKFVNRSFAVSYGLKRLYISLNISKPDKIDVVHHGINDIGNTAKTLEKSLNDEFVFCLVGRIIPLKGHKQAIEIIEKLLLKGIRAKLKIAGTGFYKNEVEKLVEDKRLGNHIEFLGSVSEPISLMRKSDIVFITSKAEGFGLIALEAFASGTPVISFDVAAINEIIEDGRAGLLIENFNTNEFVKKIIDLISSKDKFQSISKGQLQRLKTVFSKEEMVAKTIQFYNQFSIKF